MKLFHARCDTRRRVALALPLLEPTETRQLPYTSGRRDPLPAVTLAMDLIQAGVAKNAEHLTDLK